MAENLNPKRHLDLDGSYNLRDLGGYPAQNGRQTRWKAFLRSGSMHGITPEAQASLIAYGVRTVIDLRTTQEAEQQPNVFAQDSTVAYHHQNMLGDEPLIESSATEPTGEPAETILRSYRAILDQRQSQIGEILNRLLRTDPRPVVFHCAGGKDRTGIISALLLGIAAVSPQEIAADYALSARFLLNRYFTEEAPPGVSTANFTWRDFQSLFCPPNAMLKVLTYLDQQYDGAIGYARTVGLSNHQITRLQETILE